MCCLRILNTTSEYFICSLPACSYSDFLSLISRTLKKKRNVSRITFGHLIKTDLRLGCTSGIGIRVVCECFSLWNYRRMLQLMFLSWQSQSQSRRLWEMIPAFRKVNFVSFCWMFRIQRSVNFILMWCRILHSPLYFVVLLTPASNVFYGMEMKLECATTVSFIYVILSE